MTKFKIDDVVIATEIRKIECTVVENGKTSYRLSNGNWYLEKDLKKDLKKALYYMQSKRSGTDGSRLFYCFSDKKKWLNDLIDLQATSIHDLPFGPRDSDYIKRNVIRPKSEWKPYLTPDRELVKYEPKEDEDD